jgi:trimethylamine--corrinoid protein Co-methyltransferase
VDNSLSAFMAVSTLSDMLLGAGLLHGSRILSYEMLLMDAEIWSILHAMFQGIVVNDTTLAIDAIRAVGHGGTFLSNRHTRQNMRQRWQPTLIDRRPYNVWEEKRDGAADWAREKARQILREHQPEVLDPNLSEELNRIISALEAQAV